MIAEAAHGLRGSGRAVRHDDQPLAHVPEHGPHQRVEPVLASTCSSTTRRATSPASTSRSSSARTARSTSTAIATRAACSSSRRRSSSISRRTRRRASRRTATTIARSASATRTSARSSCSSAFRTTATAGRAIAAALTAIMCGHAYKASAEMAATKGPFNGFAKNREPMLRVMSMHRDAAYGIHREHCPTDLYKAGVRGLGSRREARRAARLPQRAGHRARADRHHRPLDGLRHDGHRAGLRAREVQEARRRRLLQDRQPVGARGAREPRLLAGRGAGDRRVRERHQHAPRRAARQPPHARAARASTTRISTRSKRPSRACSISRARSRRGCSARRRTSVSAVSTLKSGRGSLLRLVGFTDAQIDEASDTIVGRMTIEGAPHLRDRALPGVRLREPLRQDRQALTSRRCRTCA